MHLCWKLETPSWFLSKRKKSQGDQILIDLTANAGAASCRPGTQVSSVVSAGASCHCHNRQGRRQPFSFFPGSQHFSICLSPCRTMSLPLCVTTWQTLLPSLHTPSSSLSFARSRPKRWGWSWWPHFGPTWLGFQLSHHSERDTLFWRSSCPRWRGSLFHLFPVGLRLAACC